MIAAPIKAEEFSKRWECQSLVRPANLEKVALLPSDAREFLTKAGLPALITWF
jgi:hypothetical protein